MPVILEDEASTSLWLNGSLPSKLETLLKPYEHSDLTWYPVTPEMGKPSFDSPECIKEIPLKTESRPITNFFSKKGTIEDAKEPKKSVESSLEDLKKEPKEEPEVQIHVESELKYVTGNADTESPEPGEKCHVKREFEELQADTKPTKLETGKHFACSSNKKSKSDAKKAPVNKQSTLLSFLKKS